MQVRRPARTWTWWGACSSNRFKLPLVAPVATKYVAPLRLGLGTDLGFGLGLEPELAEVQVVRLTPRTIPNTICAGDDGIPGRAWLRYLIRSKMIVLGFMLLFSSLPGMTGLGDSVFFSERFQRIVFFQCFQVRRPERTWGLLVAGYWLPVTGCRGL